MLLIQIDRLLDVIGYPEGMYNMRRKKNQGCQGQHVCVGHRIKRCSEIQPKPFSSHHHGDLGQTQPSIAGKINLVCLEPVEDQVKEISVFSSTVNYSGNTEL